MAGFCQRSDHHSIQPVTGIERHPPFDPFGFGELGSGAVRGRRAVLEILPSSAKEGLGMVGLGVTPKVNRPLAPS